MNFLKWLWGRKTTALGYLGVLLAVLNLNPTWVSWITAPKRGTELLIFSMLVAGVGHFNNRHMDKDDGGT